jgi:ABC-type lipoprotein export system ATPase subunit
LDRQVVVIVNQIAHKHHARVIAITHDHISPDVFDPTLEIEDGLIRSSAN